jgi:hypothetical protein
MKKIIFVFTALLCISFSVKAQRPKAKFPAKQVTSIRDSTGISGKTPSKINNQNTNQSSSFRTKQPSKNQKVKLDDLKNPYDTGKVKTVRIQK